MARGGKFAHRDGTRKRKRIRSKEKGRYSDESDEDYVVGEEESDDGSSDGKFSCRNRTRKRKRERIRSRIKGKGSDDSDEDYVVGEDESDEDNSEEYCASSSREDSEGSFNLTASSRSGDSLDEGRKVARSKPRNGFAGRRKVGDKRRTYRVSSVVVDSDCEDDDDEDDEFMPNVDDSVDDEEGSRLRAKSRVRNRVNRKKGSSRSTKAKRKLKNNASKKKSSRGRQGMLGLKKVLSSDDEKKNKKGGRRRKRAIVHSDSDFVVSESSNFEYSASEAERDFISDLASNGNSSRCLTSTYSNPSKDKNKGRRRKKRGIVHSDSGSSDFEYTVSEEERDFIRELAESANSYTTIGLKTRRVFQQQQRTVAKKGKEKVDGLQLDTRKQVCENKNEGRRRKKRGIVHSDSDIVDSGSSDFEYRVSEEERDFVREVEENANSYTNMGSMMKRLLQQQQRTMAKKGKEKVDDSQLDMGKQICGICLSEERMGIIRGTLNSCFHYFCFTCIMEWSKVESRCPVCKQRFTTISKPARLDAAIGLRKTVIRVPRRDQVYRPSDEELRGYLDPYENVVCMECQQGGDDSLMLLCDICDSPAHTYCVGLGKEVPEGNWYCEGCKSSDPVSSNSHVQNLVFNQNTGNSGLFTEQSADGIDAEGFERHLPPCSTSQQLLPEQLFSPRIDILASPRCPVGEDFHVASPLSGVGASTVLERRRIRQRIRNMMSQFPEIAERNNELQHASLASDVVTTEIEQDHATFENAKSLGSADSHAVAAEDRVQGRERSSISRHENSSCSDLNRDAISARMGHVRKRVLYDLNTTPSNGPADDSLSAEQEGTISSNTVLDHDQCSEPIVGSSARILPFTSGEDAVPMQWKRQRNKCEPW